MTSTLAREIESIQAFRETDRACAGIRAMQQVGWTVDAPWSNVASRSQQRAPRPDPQGRKWQIWPSQRARDRNRHRKPSISGTARRQASCASRKVSMFKASGKATLYSYVINHRPAAPGFTPPYAIAVVELEEGPRMMSNIIDCPQTPEALELDMKLEVAFEKLDDKITLPLFRPAKG